MSSQPLCRLCFTKEGAVPPGASVAVGAHRRGPLPFPLGRLRLCVFLLLEEGRGHQPGPTLPPLPPPPRPPCTGGGLTEALLEPDSSSALGGCVAFFRLRGLESAAFRRLFGGLVDESSYSSAREKRSLNLRDRERAEKGLTPPTPPPFAQAGAPFPAPPRLAGHAVSVHLPAPPPRGRAQGASLHLVGFVAARLDVLQGLENRGLAEN